MTRTRCLTLIVFLSIAATGRSAAQRAPVHIRVAADSSLGSMTPIWSWFGYDEPNYTTMPNGRKLILEIAALGPVPPHVRTHNLLNTGDGVGALKWGSTNAYSEDAEGRPVYDWTIVDSILDTYVSSGIVPVVEIGFMPEALSSHPVPYRHSWANGTGELFTGWAYPPTDWDKWRDLVERWVRHEVERHGRAEVERWWWEVWNEPDIGYWQGTPTEFEKLYDYAADGVRRALPTARVGGPETTNPNGGRAREYLRSFLDHVLHGRNHATGGIGSPLDFVSFHAKGAPHVMPDGHVRMNVANQLRAIADGFRVVDSFPELAGVPIYIGESDPEGCAACSVRDNPANRYRNGTMYSSYTAEQIARTYELVDRMGVNLAGSVTWAFEFEGQRYFDGYRDLATNGIDKPVLNTFRMLGKMSGDRVAVSSTGAQPLDEVLSHSVTGEDDVSALATRDERSVSVLVWDYHDDDLATAPADVTLTIDGTPAAGATLEHWRIDQEHSNAFALWVAMGEPQNPTPEAYRRLEERGRLQMLEAPRRIATGGGRAVVTFRLPRQAVSLLRLVW